MTTRLDQDMVTCDHCEGKGCMTIKTKTITADGCTVGGLEVKCIWCHGAGRVTMDQWLDEQQELALWCECGTPSGRPPIFKDDGQCRRDCYRKHHYHCPDCGGVVQVG